MSDHSAVLVPTQASSFHGPDVVALGSGFDLGAVAESLIYYDRVYMVLDRGRDLKALVLYFSKSDRVADLLALLRSGELVPYHYAFKSAVATPLRSGDNIPINMQLEEQASPRAFDRLVVAQAGLDPVVPKARHRKALRRAFVDHVIEVKAPEFGTAIREVEADARDARRVALWGQAFVDEAYRVLGRTHPPRVSANVAVNERSVTINWDVDLLAIAGELGDRGDARSVIDAAINANRLIWSASTLRSDLLVASPMSQFVGDKLVEARLRLSHVGALVDTLESRVEFPNVRRLVNQGRLPIEVVLELRQKGTRFRRWLQAEAERDRDALVAYHAELAQQTGLERFGHSTFRLFQMLAPTVAGVGVGAVTAERLGIPEGTIAGHLARKAVDGFLAEGAARIGAGWKPAMFGDWARDRIATFLTPPRRRDK